MNKTQQNAIDIITADCNADMNYKIVTRDGEYEIVEKGFVTGYVTIAKIAGDKLDIIRNAIEDITSVVRYDHGYIANIGSLIGVYDKDIPVDDTAGARIALIFKLIENVDVKYDVEIKLIAWRVARFSEAEAKYWLGKCTCMTYVKVVNRWAIDGMRLMLAGECGVDREGKEYILSQIATS